MVLQPPKTQEASWLAFYGKRVITSFNHLSSMKRLFPRSFIKSTTSLLPSDARTVVGPGDSNRVSPEARAGHGKATTMTAPKKVAVKRVERRERWRGRKWVKRRGAIGHVCPWEWSNCSDKRRRAAPTEGFRRQEGSRTGGGYRRWWTTKWREEKSVKYGRKSRVNWAKRDWRALKHPPANSSLSIGSPHFTSASKLSICFRNLLLFPRMPSSFTLHRLAQTAQM